MTKRWQPSRWVLALGRWDVGWYKRELLQQPFSAGAFLPGAGLFRLGLPEGNLAFDARQVLLH